MGECIITRAAGEAEAALPISPGYHTVGVTLRDPFGKIMVNWPVNCIDGSSTYNYKTNEKGQTIFMVNSGSANIFVNNYGSDGIEYIDLPTCWTNIDAPAGLSTKVNINLNNGTVFHEFIANKVFGLYYDRNISNLILVGGGGGGGSTHTSDSDETHAGGGGAGYMNQYNNINLINGNYNFIVGAGGGGGIYNSKYNWGIGFAGGTSYIYNTSYSAIGGKGGGSNGAGGAGGLGKGGNSKTNGTNSPVNFAGGGGGGSGWLQNFSGGSPYGGRGGYSSAWSGSRGGGGGAIRASGTESTSSAGSGGAGLIRINIQY